MKEVSRPKSFSQVNVKNMPTEKVNSVSNPILKRIAQSVNANVQGVEHQNHNSGGGHSRS
ncbi:hypothetical protein J0A68_22200 [Algoriphagus sp. H41]|uniref:Uncharacterized protein n=1 Tax=Algoriphagus oliviformis TaxID=2811231 RepID=A0ABS3CBY4_9BACT|nr:hypothetical protein [Algoriphagus oliviformis]MBN7813685.1 hypothetical protein [Algoriphagus oliviformis]